MDRKLKETIRLAYEVSIPNGKTAFLSQFREPLIGRGQFLLNQLGYMSKTMYVICGAVLASVIWFITTAKPDGVETLWTAGAFLPFLTLFSVTEFMRSMSWSMAELEMSCRYSLADVIMARSFIMGVLQLITVIAIMVFSSGTVGLGFTVTAVYMLTPYLLSLVLSMALLRRIKRRESVYLSVAVCCGISGASSAAKYMYSFIFETVYIKRWCILFIVLTVLAVYEFIKLKKNLEDNEWNLSLIV